MRIKKRNKKLKERAQRKEKIKRQILDEASLSSNENLSIETETGDEIMHVESVKKEPLSVKSIFLLKFFL